MRNIKRRENFDCYIVPIDACYEFVGRIRRCWKGFDGGEEAWSRDRRLFCRPARAQRRSRRGNGDQRMSELAFTIVDARVEPYAVIPTLVFRSKSPRARASRFMRSRCAARSRSSRGNGAIASAKKSARLSFSARRIAGVIPCARCLWTQVSLMVPGFDDKTMIDVPITCTYDFEVVAAKYLAVARRRRSAAACFLFSGTIFARGQLGFSVEQISWEKEAKFRSAGPAVARVDGPLFSRQRMDPAPTRKFRRALSL